MEYRIAPIELNNPVLAELFFTGHDISDQFIEEILALPRHDLINDLEQMIRYGIDRFEFVQSMDSDGGKISSFPMIALFLLTELKSENSFPLLLELCKCEEDLLDFYFGDHTTETMWQDAMLLGFNQVNDSDQFFKDGRGTSFSGNCIVSDGLTQLYLQYPEKRQEVQEAFREILDYLWAKDTSEDDHELNEIILNAVADTRDTDLYPLCKPFFEEGRTDYSMTADWEEFEEILNSDSNYTRSILDIRSRLNYFERMTKDHRELEKEMYSSDTIVRAEPKTHRNDPCPCGSGLKYKKCCLNEEQI